MKLKTAFHLLNQHVCLVGVPAYNSVECMIIMKGSNGVVPVLFYFMDVCAIFYRPALWKSLEDNEKSHLPNDLHTLTSGETD